MDDERTGTRNRVGRPGPGRATLVIALALLACSGFAAARAEVPGQLLVDPDSPAWWMRTDGSPAFLCGPGDPEGFLYLGTRQPDGTRAGGGQDAMIQRLANQGGNALYVIAIRSHGGDGGATENPFVDSDPARGLDPDILDQWDGWFRSMDQAGITVYLLVYDDGACAWGCDPGTDAVPIEERSFLTELVDRFEHLAHLVWLPAEESQEAFSRARVSAQGAAILAADDHDHPIASHQLPGTEFDHPVDPAVRSFSMQCETLGGVTCDGTTTPEEVHHAVVQARGGAANGYNVTMAEIAYGGTGTGARARRILWASAMGGSYVLVNGWNLTGPDDPPDSNLNECRWLADFFESARLRGLVPGDARAAGDTKYALVDDRGPAHVLYTDAYASGLGLTDLAAGPYALRWLDTVTGTVVERSFDHPAFGPATFSRPAELGDAVEIALYIEGCADDDGDGICSAVDNCVEVSNPDQADGDRDRFGDACDPCPGCTGADGDGDGLCCTGDNCPHAANPDQADADGNGIGDACEAGGRVAEIHYEQAPGEQEFIELLITGDATDLTGWRVSDQDEIAFRFDGSDPRFGCDEPFEVGLGTRVVVFHGPGTAVCDGPVRQLYLDDDFFLQRDGDDIVLRDRSLRCRDYVAFENGAGVQAAPEDCAWTGPNPTNLDLRGGSLSRFDGAPFTDSDSGLDWEASGETTTVGPTTAGEPNEASADADGDGRPDVEDNCVGTPNPTQSDIDGDGEGDPCDGDDGRVWLTAGTASEIRWRPDRADTGWNLYRGDLDVLRATGVYTQEPGSNPAAFRACVLTSPSFDDPNAGPSGSRWYYLVSRMVDGVESDLSADGTGTTRPNDNPCP